MSQVIVHTDDPIARLERRTRARRHELSRSIDDLELAVRSSLPVLPTQSIEHAVDDRPYQSVVLAFGVGCLIGSLL